MVIFPRKKHLIILLLLIIGSSTLVQLQIEMAGNGGSGSAVYSPGTGLSTLAVPHAPISILGNTNLTEANGVKDQTVSGNITDPFIIEGWQITTSSIGIEIRDTRAYIIIQLCAISRYTDASGYGIYIENATHVLVQNNSITAHQVGIYFVDSNSTDARFNEIYYSSWGIYADNIFNSTFNWNHVYGVTNTGMKADFSDHCFILDNEIEFSYRALGLWQSTDLQIIDNYCHHNEKYAIFFLYGCYNNNITQNTFTKTYEYAVGLQMSQNNIIHHNDLSLNGMDAIYYATGWTDDIHNNTEHQSNEMWMSALPSISFSNSTMRFYKEYSLHLFTADAGAHELMLKFVYERHLDGNATILMQASIYTRCGYYTVNSLGEFIFDGEMTYNGTKSVAFAYRSDGTGWSEPSAEVYHFPMCALNVSESLEAIPVTLNLFYECWSDEWTRFSYSFSTVIQVSKYDNSTSSGDGGDDDEPIPSFSFAVVLFSLLSIFLIKTLELKRKSPL